MKLLVSSVLVLVALIFVATRSGVDFQKVFQLISSMPAGWIAAAVLFCVLQVLGQTGRFWALFPAQRRPTFFETSRIFLIGQFLNVFVPARAGEVAKALMLSQLPQERRWHVADSAGILLSEKAIDVAALLLWALIARADFFPSRPGSGPAQGEIGWFLLGGIFLGVLALGIAMAQKPEFALVVKSWARRVGNGLSALKSPVRAGGSFLFSTMQWWAECVAIYCLSRALGVHLNPMMLMTIILWLNTGIAIPVSVANLGVFEAAMVFGFSRFGVDQSTALAIATVHHGLQMVVLAVPAAVLFLKSRPVQADSLA